MSIGSNVAAGVIAFAPLGPEYLAAGVVAGMLSSIVGGFVASLAGGTPGMIVGPQATTAMAFAALLSQLIATGHFDGRPDFLLSLAFSAVMLSGGIQILLGAFRVGGLAKFIPYPVVAGIINTSAILLVGGQFWTLVGVDPGGAPELSSFLEMLGRAQPATLVVSAVTAAIAWKGGRVLPTISVPVVALGVGTAVHHLLQRVLGVGIGPQLPVIEVGLPTPHYLTGIFAALGEAASLGLLGTVIAGAIAIAVLDSIGSLIALVSYQGIADRRFSANGQLVGQGAGGLVTALFGGLTNAGSLGRTSVNHHAGGRTRLSGVVNAVSVLVLVLALARPLSWIPKAAIAGMIVVIAVNLLDRWVIAQARAALRRDAKNTRDNWIAVGQMVFVVVVGMLQGLVAAVGAGVALSVVVFVAQMSRPPIRAVRTGLSASSARRRAGALTEVLRTHADRIAVLQLEGMIFFGSCDSLAARTEALAEGGADFVLLDFRRVHGVDPTGYKVLGQIYERLTRRGATLAFSHVVPGQLNTKIAEDLELSGVSARHMFESADRALEFFEEELLAEAGADALRIPAWTVADFGAEWRLTPAECEVFEKVLEPGVFEDGDVVFREGDVGRSLYLIARGTADVMITLRSGRRSRVATFQQGTSFGEMAFLDGEPRAARIDATSRLEVFELTQEAFERLSQDEHDTAMKVQTAIARLLGTRLRGANDVILELES